MPGRADEDGTSTADEKTPLLKTTTPSAETETQKQLSAVAAACCIVDLFGVFPVLALPRSLLSCGWWGVALMLPVVALQAHTARLLGRSWLLAAEARPRWAAMRHRAPVAALTHLAFGARARNAVTFLLNVAVFGSYVPDLLFAAENMQLVGRRLWELEDAGLSFCVWLVILGILLCPMLWLGSPKDQKLVTGISVGLVIAVTGLTWACVAHSPWPPPQVPSEFRPSLPPFTLQAAALAFGNLIFQFDAHPSLLTVQVDMREPKRLGNAIAGAYTISCFLALTTTAITGILRPGTAGRADVLQALPGSPPLYAAVLLATLQIVLSTVVAGSALFNDIEQRLRIPPVFSWRRCVLRGFLLAAAVLVALASPRLPLAMGLLGAAVTGPLALVLPPLLHARLIKGLRPSSTVPGLLAFESTDDEDTKALIATRRSSVETAQAEAEATAAAEAKARNRLFTDEPYRELSDDTRTPAGGDEGTIKRAYNALKDKWHWLVRTCDRRLQLDDAAGQPPRFHTAACIVLATIGALASAIALVYAVMDAAAGARAGRGPASCLGLPF